MESSGSSKQKKNRENTHKNSARKKFPCSCGKSYMNYSSLYVHAMVKHNRKITSKNMEKGEGGNYFVE